MMRCCAFIVLAITAPTVASAAEITTDAIRLGDTIVGAKPAEEDFKGRVVLVEKWGIH